MANFKLIFTKVKNKIFIKDLTIVTGHPVLGGKGNCS